MQRRRNLAGFALLVVVTASGWTPAPGGRDLAAEAIVDAVNARDIGAPGWRRVRVDVVDDGVVARSLTVVNAWRRLPDEVRTLFYLEQPAGLRGTSYLQIERLGVPAGLEVFLHLPTSGGRLLSIAAEDLGEGLLGSDFGYDDMRMVLPRGACRYRLVGETRLRTRTVVALRATPDPAAPRPWTSAVFYVDPATAFVLGVDYFTGSPQPAKRLRVDRFARIDGVWTAEQMTMSAGRGRATRITLLGSRFHLPPLEASFWDLDQLPRAGERLAKMLAAAPVPAAEPSQ